MTADPRGSAQDRAEILAAELMVQADAARLAALYISVIANQIRCALPTAHVLVVDTAPWYFATEHSGGNVDLLAVLDDHNMLLWAKDSTDGPDTAGWNEALEEIEFDLLAALRYATPHLNGWDDQRKTTVDLSSLSIKPDFDVHVIKLPPAQQPSIPTAGISSAVVASARALARQCGLLADSDPARSSTLVDVRIHNPNDPPPQSGRPTVALAADGRLLTHSPDVAVPLWWSDDRGPDHWTNLAFPVVVFTLPNHMAIQQAVTTSPEHRPGRTDDGRSVRAVPGSPGLVCRPQSGRSRLYATV